MSTILITGANGFLGHYLTQQLIEKGHKVIATGKGECRLPFEDANFIYSPLDFTNPENIEEVFRLYNPQVIIHAGAISKPDECENNRMNAFLTNVSGTINLLQQAAVYKSFFVFLSTDFVFDGQEGMYTEKDHRHPVNYYGETKMMAEDAVMKYGWQWAIVRTVLVYGKPFSGRDNIISNVVKSLEKKETIKIFSDQVRTPTYVEDLASGIVSIIEKGATGIYHISGEDVRTPFQMAVEAAELKGLDKDLIISIKEGDLSAPAKRPLKTGFNISKAKSELGFQPLSFREGLIKMFKV